MDMPSEVRARYKKLRIAGKTGLLNLDDETRKFLTECNKKWPEECRKIGDEVFEETKPFGATRKGA